jgi:hypothetical protein
MDNNQNPESLHDTAKTRKQMVGNGFVTPGIPAPMANAGDRKTGVVNPAANAKLKEAMTQPDGNGNSL